jgi:membrane fusion protein (multidrug efflux system)
VKKGDTLIILENKDQLMTLQQAEAALGTAKSNLNTANSGRALKKASVHQTQQWLLQMHKLKQQK